MKNKEVKERWIAARYINEDGTVLDFTGLYEVSDQGRVRSLNYNHTKKAKVLRPGTIENNDGSILYQVVLRKNNKKYCKKVHRLVLSSFNMEDWKPGRVVDHIEPRDSDTCDNRLSNLRWVDYSQNRTTEHCNELMSRALTNRKDLSKKVKVSDLATGEVTTYPSAREAARSLGVPRNAVSTMINYQNGYYKKLNLHFEYV